MAVERRLTELAGPVGGRLHTARSRNDQVATDVALFTREAALAGVEAVHRAHGRADRRRRAPPRLAAAGLHPPAARPAGLSEPSPAGLRVDARARPRARCASPPSRRRRCRWAPARWPASTSTPTAAPSPPSSASSASRRTRSTPSPTATTSWTTWVPPPPARRTSRAWAASSCCGPPRSSASSSCPTHGRAARRSCPRRRTPMPPSCCGPRRRGSSAHLAALHGVMHALPLTYNKDMQEDKEHLFDAVDTLGLCLAAAAGMIAGARFRRERMAAAASDELIAATDLADLLVKRGMPFREAHGVVAGLVREAVESGARRWPRWPCRRSARTPRRCSSAARGWSRRSARAGRRWRGSASSWSAPARCCDRPRVLRPPRARGRSRPHRLRRAPRRHRGRDRRDRGLPPLRARLARVRRG